MIQDIKKPSFMWKIIINFYASAENSKTLGLACARVDITKMPLKDFVRFIEKLLLFNVGLLKRLVSPIPNTNTET